jgi:hypothetical protein
LPNQPVNTTSTVTFAEVQTPVIRNPIGPLRVGGILGGTAFLDFAPAGSAGTGTTISGTQSADRDIFLPDATGTVALTSQLPNQAVNTTSTVTFAQVNTPGIKNPAGTFSIYNPFVNTISLGFTPGGTNNTSTTLVTAQTANRNIDLPDASGTVALTSQIPTNTTFVDLTTAQTVAGAKTFTGAPLTLQTGAGVSTLMRLNLPGGTVNGGSITCPFNNGNFFSNLTINDMAIKAESGRLHLGTAGNVGSTSQIQLSPSVVDINGALNVTNGDFVASVLPFGGISSGGVDNATTVSVTVAGVFVPLAGITWTAGPLNGFSSASNVLTYTGSRMRTFLVSYAITILSVGNDQKITAAVYFNGGINQSSVQSSRSSNNVDRPAQIACSFLTTFSSGMPIDLRITNNTATGAQTPLRYNLTVTPMLN